MTTTWAIAVISAALLSAAAAAQPYGFTCTSAPATCSALIEYLSPNATTYAAIESIFQIPHLPLLAANNLPTFTRSATSIPPNTLVRIPFPCTCASSTGASAHTPTYTVKAGDGLDAIAKTVFMQLVTYQQIAAANKLPDPNQIDVGQKLWIPLPCSCDPVGGKAVVHLGHVVAAKSTVKGIAAEFGTDEQTLLQLNGIAQPKDLIAGSVIDVPLQACTSSINKTSVDYNLLVPNGSYALTARNCVLCSCSSSQLDCHTTPDLSLSKCPSAKCGNLSLGNTTGSGCDAKTCSYAGYTNTTGFSILTDLSTQPICPASPSPSPSRGEEHPKKSNGGGPAKLGLKDSGWIVLLLSLHAILMCYWFM